MFVCGKARVRLIAVMILSITATFVAPAQADSITPIDLFPSDVLGYAAGLSGDGSTIIGYSGPNYSTSSGFRWTATNGLVGTSPGGASRSSALGVSYDGSVILGYSDLGYYVWTAADG